jgi:hypothetical protein
VLFLPRLLLEGLLEEEDELGFSFGFWFSPPQLGGLFALACISLFREVFFSRCISRVNRLDQLLVFSCRRCCFLSFAAGFNE